MPTAMPVPATMASVSTVVAKAATAPATAPTPCPMRRNGGLRKGAGSALTSAPGRGLGGARGACQGAEQSQCQPTVTQGVHGANLSIQPLTAQAINCYP